MIEVRNPVNQFFDKDGTALDAGYIYIGVSGANPETSPQSVYWDKAGLIPAAQPIRTLNGYPSRDGAVSKFYTSTKNYSVTIKDKRGLLVQSTPNSDSGIFDELSVTSGAAGVGYNNTTSGLAATQVQAAIDELNADIESANTDIGNLRDSFSGLVNLFANSAFKVNQRGYVSGTATVGANQYTLDRLRVVVSGESLTVAASTFGNKITAPAGGVEQVIEGSFVTGGDYACNWVGTGTIQVNGITKEKKETFTLTADANVTVKMVGEFEQFMFTRPDMVGRYEYDYRSDLMMCKRYYERSGIILIRANGATGFVYASHAFKADKRNVPSVTLGNITYTNAASASAGNISSGWCEISINASAGTGFASLELFATSEF